MTEAPLDGTGPLRVGEPTTSRLRQALGSAPVLLLFGAAETDVPNFLAHPGLTLFTTPAYGVFPLGLGGTPCVEGAGWFDLPSVPAPEMGGVRVFAQVLVGDQGAAGGIAASNGVERLIGF